MLFDILNSGINSLITALSFSWWVILPIILFFIAKDLWLRYIRTLEINGIEWITLELSVPEEVLKTPKAMEQVFASMFSIYSFGRFESGFEKWWDGKIDSWVSFEMVGVNGAMHFYIHTPKGFQNMIETAIYSQFPNSEINLVDDYMDKLPETLPNKNYDMFGAEFGFVKDDPYPIKTYPMFEEDVDERRIDPVAAIAEVMARLKDDESLLMQYVISPVGKLTGQDLEKEGKEIVDELGGLKKPKPKGGLMSDFIEGVGEFVANFFIAIVRIPEWGGSDKKEEKKEKDFMNMTKGVSKIIEGIENKTGKPAFEVSVRVIYIDRKDSFSPLNVAAIFGYFSQYNTPAQNSFKPALAGYSKPLGRFFPFLKTMFGGQSKRFMYFKYRNRFIGSANHLVREELPIFSTEELATLFHFPITGVEAPSLRRLSSKKSEPPSSLPLK